ncbi:hypothetical protein LI171_04915 [Emergencia timonensis]|nr:hypothetical protein [Emergencia timonensis]MCB6475579.1 hypothetical protein [Emergencia timonensis]
MKVRIIETGEITIECDSIDEAAGLYNDGVVETDKYVRFEEVVEEEL